PIWLLNHRNFARNLHRIPMCHPGPARASGSHVMSQQAPSPRASNAELVRSLYKAWNQRDWLAVRAGLAADVEWFHATRHELVRGVDAVVDLLKAAADAFPDAHVDIHCIHEAGEFVIVEWSASRGTLESRVGSDRERCEAPACVDEQEGEEQRRPI